MRRFFYSSLPFRGAAGRVKVREMFALHIGIQRQMIYLCVRESFFVVELAVILLSKL